MSGGPASDCEHESAQRGLASYQEDTGVVALPKGDALALHRGDLNAVVPPASENDDFTQRRSDT